MIKYNDNTINDWDFGTSNLIKVYRNNAIVFYKVSGESPTPEYKVCFAVVNDITQYSDTEFEDVFNKADGKWYKLNNLNQYEEYGIYGSGRTDCSANFTELTDIIAQSTTALTNHNVTVTPAVGSFSKIRIDTTKSATTTSYDWATFTKTPNGTEVLAISTGTIGAMAGYGKNKNYVTDANGSQTFAHWVDTNHTIVEIDIAALSNNQASELYLLFYQENCNTAAFSFYMQAANCVTTYNGKLTIDDGYEYEWNGSSWVNLGEVSGSSRVPIGYTEVEYIRQNSNYNAYINTGVIIFDNTTNTYTITTRLASEFHSNLGCATIISCEALSSPYNGLGYRYKCSSTVDQLEFFGGNPNYNSSVVDNGDGTRTVTFQSTSNTSYTTNVPLSFLCSFNNSSYTSAYRFADATIYSSTIVKNGITVRDFVPAKRDSDNKYGLYDIVNDVFYVSPNNVDFSGGEPITPTEYPKYYSEKSDPLNDLTFNTLAEAQTYAYNNCVYDGMKATIDGDRYYFDSEDENGWVKILEYYKVEDVTPSGGSGWTISGSSTYNPDSSYYDDFDLETTSTSYVTKIAKVTIYGYDHFTYYLRTSGYSNNCYAVATNVDEIQTPPTSIGYNSSSAITNTYSFNKSPKSAVNLSNYRRVTYNNLDKTVEHTFYVYFYGRTHSNYVGNATILIPKKQTNENWEQVTFSASSNVASSQKNLYIDNNNSTSGGTPYWYYRWIVGLPSGSHSSYTNYTDFNYCPNAISSTFTSVAGEQRQVNFTYNNTTSKSLLFRLTDGSNVLTPSDTVYYNMTVYNSCGVSESWNNLTFPRGSFVKVGGSFRFYSSSDRHYIYGYSPNISLNYNYYVDDYQDTFDITYTKLSEEAVTITYTTYDPNDSETPAFKTDITYPYNGGTTSSTTLTSFDVPYTYSYEVSQTSDKFSASTYEYTAGQASRTISFILYPNNREFATVADMEAYAYAWEGMKASVGSTKYEYKNGEWVEKQYSLPDVPFVLNYNAKQYNASTQTFAKTEGQLADTDVTISGGTLTAHDGYVTVASGSRGVINSYPTYFNRTNSTPNLTIISKQRTEGNYGHMFSNRDSNYNWMYRPYSNKLTLHGYSEQGQLTVTTQPVIESVRIDSNRLATYNNYTDNTSSTQSSFSYGSTNGSVALFAGYVNSTGEWFVGDFYWIYMSQTTLTDEQVQQVIDYNENL